MITCPLLHFVEARYLKLHDMSVQCQKIHVSGAPSKNNLLFSFLGHPLVLLLQARQSIRQPRAALATVTKYVTTFLGEMRQHGELVTQNI